MFKLAFFSILLMFGTIQCQIFGNPQLDNCINTLKVEQSRIRAYYDRVNFNNLEGRMKVVNDRQNILIAFSACKATTSQEINNYHSMLLTKGQKYCLTEVLEFIFKAKTSYDAPTEGEFNMRILALTNRYAIIWRFCEQNLFKS